MARLLDENSLKAVKTYIDNIESDLQDNIDGKANVYTISSTTTINDLKHYGNAEGRTWFLVMVLGGWLTNGLYVLSYTDGGSILGLTISLYPLQKIKDSYFIGIKNPYSSSDLISSITFREANKTCDTPVANNDVANKKYVDDNKSSKTLLGSAQTSYLMDDSDAHTLGLTMTFSNTDVTGYDLLLLTGLNSSCFILVTQVLTDLLSVMNLPYRDSGITTICKVRATKTGSDFVIDVSSPNVDMFNFTNLPTFYLYGIKL